MAKIKKYAQLQKEKEEEYKQAIANGDNYFNSKNYKQAYVAYQMAEKVKPNEKYPKERMEEITNLIAGIKDGAYTQAIAEGDRLYNAKDFGSALPYYEKASKLKPAESHPKNRIKEINATLLAAKGKETAYKEAIANGNRLFDAKEYEAARGYYVNASKIKPNEALPKNRIAEIDKFMSVYAENKAIYDKHIASGNALFNSKNYPAAKSEFEKAKKVLPFERYPKEKIKEIELLIGSAQLAGYKNLIVKADFAYEAQKLKEARGLYKRAQKLQPGKLYPQEQITKISNVLDRADYEAAVAQGDKDFSSQNYEYAKLSYEMARRLLPNEPYPLKKLAEIAKLNQSDAFANAIDEIVSEFIAKNTTRKFKFTPIKSKSTSNYILVKARNLSGKPFRILLNYGQDNSNNGGLVLGIDDIDEIKIYTVKVGEQTNWVSIANNWLSLSPVGGDVEILGIEIKEGN